MQLSENICFTNAHLALFNKYLFQTLTLWFVKCWFLFSNNCQYEQLLNQTIVFEQFFGYEFGDRSKDDKKILQKLIPKSYHN